MANRKRTKQTYAEHVIGPRKVGGIYRSGYGDLTYEVLEINVDDATASVEIVEQDLDGRYRGRVRRHCTPWDWERDEVVQEPASQEHAGHPARR